MYNYIKLPQALQQVRQHRFVTLKWVPADYSIQDNEKVDKLPTQGAHKESFTWDTQKKTGKDLPVSHIFIWAQTLQFWGALRHRPALILSAGNNDNNKRDLYSAHLPHKVRVQNALQ